MRQKPDHAPLAATILAAGFVMATPLPASALLDELAGLLVSDEQVRQLGEQSFEEIKRNEPLSDNRNWQRQLDEIGARIVAVSGSDIPREDWDFVVFAGEQVNAFALPGGRVGAYAGMMELVANEAQLAAVLSHEVAHVTERHVAERIGTSELASLGSQLIGSMLAGDSGWGRELGSLLGLGAEYGIVRPFGRDQELEADATGMMLMARAGYDPTEAVAFWQRMLEADDGADIPVFLSTHPSDESRIEALEEQLPKARAAFAPPDG